MTANLFYSAKYYFEIFSVLIWCDRIKNKAMKTYYLVAFLIAAVSGFGAAFKYLPPSPPPSRSPDSRTDCDCENYAEPVCSKVIIYNVIISTTQIHDYKKSLLNNHRMERLTPTCVI